MRVELQFTYAQLSEINASHPKYEFLDERKCDAIEQIIAWKEFQSSDNFTEFMSSILDRAVEWEFQNIEIQREIQRILFPDGVFYDVQREHSSLFKTHLTNHLLTTLIFQLTTALLIP